MWEGRDDGERGLGKVSGGGVGVSDFNPRHLVFLYRFHVFRNDYGLSGKIYLAVGEALGGGKEQWVKEGEKFV